MRLAGGVEDGPYTPHIYGPTSVEGRWMISLWNPPTRTWRTRLIVRIRTRPIGTVSAASHVDGDALRRRVGNLPMMWSLQLYGHTTVLATKEMMPG
jgi:hypothetical protein